MTRPESLAMSLVRAASASLTDRRAEINRGDWPRPKLTARVRRLYREYKQAQKRTERLKKALANAGGDVWSRGPQMHDTGAAKTAALAAVDARIRKVNQLKEAALLAVLGVSADKARPTILKLKRDLQRAIRQEAGAL